MSAASDSDTPLPESGCNAARRRGTVLAFDFGERRLGVAVGEMELGLAHPLETVRAGSDRERMSHVERLLKQWAPTLLLVGFPSYLDGAEHEMSRRCRRFAERLRFRFSIHTELVDERLTSRTASQSLAEAGVRGRRQKELLDQVAAQHILQAWFEGRHAAA